VEAELVTFLELYTDKTLKDHRQVLPASVHRPERIGDVEVKLPRVHYHSGGEVNFSSALLPIERSV
jgi:hypothetical protein